MPAWHGSRKSRAKEEENQGQLPGPEEGGRSGAGCGCTCGEGYEGIIPLQAPVLIQEVLGVEPFGAFKLGAIIQDGAEQGKDFCALRKRRPTQRGKDSGQVVIWGKRWSDRGWF